MDAANITLIDGDKVYSYVRQDGQDLCVFDMNYAVGVRGCDAFDPRIIGLSAELLPASLTVRDCLWYPWADKLVVVASEELDGVRVAHVRAIRDGVIADLWIEESTARLYRTTMHDDDAEIQTEIVSEFDEKDTTSPFPSRVRTRRVDRSGTSRHRVVVSSFEFGKKIPAERLTLKSLNLPKNSNVFELSTKGLALARLLGRRYD